MRTTTGRWAVSVSGPTDNPIAATPSPFKVITTTAMPVRPCAHRRPSFHPFKRVRKISVWLAETLWYGGHTRSATTPIGHCSFTTTGLSGRLRQLVFARTATRWTLIFNIVLAGAITTPPSGVLVTATRETRFAIHSICGSCPAIVQTTVLTSLCRIK